MNPSRAKRFPVVDGILPRNRPRCGAGEPAEGGSRIPGEPHVKNSGLGIRLWILRLRVLDGKGGSGRWPQTPGEPHVKNRTWDLDCSFFELTL